MEMPCITIPVGKSRANLAGKRGASFAEKLMGNRGVSFVEMLLCVLILTLSTGVIVSTLDLGIRHFQARTRETEQRLLCNTLSLAVQEYLTYANKIEYTESDGVTYLTRLKTGALGGALESRWCAFVTGFYQVNNQNKIEFVKNPASVTDGALAIEYAKDGEAQYYDLAGYSQYIAKKNGTDVDLKLKSAVDVKVDASKKRFNVTITVKNADGGTKDAESTFFVMPINPGVFE